MKNYTYTHAYTYMYRHLHKNIHMHNWKIAHIQIHTQNTHMQNWWITKPRPKVEHSTWHHFIHTHSQTHSLTHTRTHTHTHSLNIFTHTNAQLEDTDVNITTSDGRTALYLSSLQGSLSCVRLLISNGADHHIKTKEGRNALDVANLFGHAHVVTDLQAALELPPPPRRYVKCVSVRCRWRWSLCVHVRSASGSSFNFDVCLLRKFLRQELHETACFLPQEIKEVILSQGHSQVELSLMFYWQTATCDCDFCPKRTRRSVTHIKYGEYAYIHTYVNTHIQT